MKFFLFFLTIIIFLTFVSASLVPNKGNLEIETMVNQEKCELIQLTSDDYTGKVIIRDMWAESYETETALRNFKVDANFHDILFDYPSEVDFEKEKNIELCFTPQKAGKYKGAIIFTPESSSNTVVEMGTWLFLNVEPTTQQNTESQELANKNSVTGSGDTASTAVNAPTTVQNTVEEKTELNKEKENTEENNAGITGNVIGTGYTTISFIIILFLCAIVALSVLIYKIRGKDDFTREFRI
ncbi:MAG: hypothetical protein RL557_867 [archaeon]|jgi:hypothetical protein